MNDEQAQTNDAMITLEGEDGNSYACQILDIFDFENREYALLLKMPGGQEADEEDEGSLVIMRLIQRDEQSIFQTIESDEEFDRVVAHVEALARASEDEGAGED